MIVALILGRRGSTGLPSKNSRPLLGRPLAWYPMNAALAAGVVDAAFMSTDDPALMDVARDIGFETIDRPPELCTTAALAEDAYKHGLDVIRQRLGQEPELLVLLFANAPTVTPAHIQEGVRVLRERPDLDSAVTVSVFNMYSPLRARRIGDDGLVHPFVPFESFADPKTLNCDRNSQGDVMFADVALCVVRPRNLDNLETGILPQKWMGQRIHPLPNEGGLDIDYEWQWGQAEWWLRRHGFTETTTPWSAPAMTEQVPQ